MLNVIQVSNTTSGLADPTDVSITSADAITVQPAMPHPLIALAALSGMAGGGLPEPRPAICPPNGPQDVRVYATIAAISTASGGMIGPDGRVATIHADERRVVLHDVALIETLLNDGFLESVDHQTVRVTDKGSYWLSRFHKHNRFKSRGFFGERSCSR